MKAAERKFISRERTSTNIGLTWAGGEMNPSTFLCLTSMAQGDASNERIGRSIVFDSLRIKGIVKLPTLAGSTIQPPVAIRIIVYQDKQTNNAEVAAECVMAANPSNPVLAFRNMFEADRFKILGDQTIMLTPQSGAGDGAVNDWGAAHQFFKFAFTRLNMSVGFTLGTGNIDAVSDNSIQIAMIADGSVPTVRYQSRGYYLD